MIRVGIIGCGKIAQVRHLPEYAANPNAEIVAYYDKNRARAEEMAAKYGGSVCDTYFDLLNRDDIDAVSVCVENRSHAEISTAALYAGKHVLCEKPMAVTLAECESMVAAAERNGKYLMIGHNMRFDPVHRRAKQLLDRGVIGDVITFRAVLGNAGPEGWSVDEGTWFFDKNKAALGALSDMGIHKVDLLQYLLGQKVIETTAKVVTPSSPIIVSDMEGNRTSYNLDVPHNGTGVIDEFVDALVNDRQPEVSGREALTVMRSIFASIKSSNISRTVAVNSDFVTHF